MTGEWGDKPERDIPWWCLHPRGRLVPAARCRVRVIRLKEKEVENGKAE